MTALELAAWALAALPVIALAFTLLNVLTWQRGDPRSRLPRSVSVLIPARNEAENIEACVRAVLANEHPLAEVLVFDDASTDATPEIVERLAAGDARVRLLRGDGLPSGWVGKAHACHRLAEAARGELLVFVDADVRLSPEALGRIASLISGARADVVTAVPRQVMDSFAERLVLPLLHLTYTSWFPLFLVRWSRDVRFLAANGQLLAVTRDAYRSTGGFAAVRGEVVEDMAFCRRAKSLGHGVVFADGHHMAACRMYASARGVWEGFSKNLYPGLGARPFALGAVLGLYGAAFVLPFVLWPLGALGLLPAALQAPVVIAVGANLLLRGVLALRFSHPASGLVLQPLAVLALLAIALNSFAWHRRGAIRWRGRVYPGRAMPGGGP
jgi:chlorobactene glucosyltransferase